LYVILKVLINEKRGGLKVVSFDRSRFKLFTNFHIILYTFLKCNVAVIIFK
jgi:hypothetical protein